MRAREAASQIAAASLASFLPLAPSRRYGLTSCAEMIRASSPSAIGLRAQWCALELASIATTQPAGSLEHQGMKFSRDNARSAAERVQRDRVFTLFRPSLAAVNLKHLHIHVRDRPAAEAIYAVWLGMRVARRGRCLTFMTDDEGFDIALMDDAAPSPMPA